MKTVLLPKNNIEQKLNRDKLSEFCDAIKVCVETQYLENKKEFILQSGPPYANSNSLHIGHLLNMTLKDFYIKYLSLNGYKVKVRFGWDCHGLPIENKAKVLEGDLFKNCADIANNSKIKHKENLDLFGIFSTEPDYMTLSDDFVKRELEIFNQLKSNGFIFKKKKPTWYSPTLNTVLANSEIEYKDIKEESLYFLLPTQTFGEKLLVWTTTEWTVAGNQAVCLSPNISYCKTDSGMICSKKFADISGLNCTPYDVSMLTHYTNPKGEQCPVLFDEFVTDTETGIVHLCGGHGDEDYDVLVKNGIEPKNVVEDLKELLEHINNFILPAEFVYCRSPLEHSYPVDWRLKEKVYKVLTEQTYLDFDWTKIKQTVKQIKLSSKDRTRLESMLFSRKDWCLSRQRKWGVQIPDSEDILDVWFDSGTVFSMNDKPADLYIEGTDQHRGWFQSSIIIASMVDKIPTNRILTHGFVVNELGEKFAKSAENYSPLEQMYHTYNPDVMRLWILLSDYKNDIVFSKDSIDSAGKQYFRVRNFVRYLVNNLHREKHSLEVRTDLQEQVKKLKDNIQKDVDEFNLNKAIRNFVNFTNQYSSYLTEDIKNKFYESDINDSFREELENEFYYLSVEIQKILFPFLPFLSMEIKQGLNLNNIK